MFPVIERGVASYIDPPSHRVDLIPYIDLNVEYGGQFRPWREPARISSSEPIATGLGAVLGNPIFPEGCPFFKARGCGLAVNLIPEGFADEISSQLPLFC